MGRDTESGVWYGDEYLLSRNPADSAALMFTQNKYQEEDILATANNKIALAGKNRYRMESKLLHQHCHDKTTKVNLKIIGGTERYGQITEEPSDEKSSCSVLEPSQRGDPLTQVNIGGGEIGLLWNLKIKHEIMGINPAIYINLHNFIFLW